MRRLRLVVLVSGRGSNLENLLRASRDGRMAADVVRVVSNKPAVRALDVAAAAGVEGVVVESRGLTREEHEKRLVPILELANPDLVVLAGYMRILSHSFIQRYRGRLVNIHPSLLPSFPGLDAQLQAHERDVRIAGCTTHFVTEQVDGGPIIAQAAVAIPPGATPDEMRERILVAEHRLYPLTIHLIATGRARLEGARVVHEPGDAREAPADVLVSPAVAP